MNSPAAQIMCMQPRPMQQQQFPAQASSNKRRANFDSSPALLKRQRCTHSLPAADDPVVIPSFVHPGVVSPGVNLRHTQPHHHHNLLSTVGRPPQGFPIGERSGDAPNDHTGMCSIHDKNKHTSGVTTPSLPHTAAAAVTTTTESSSAHHHRQHYPVVAGGSGVNMSFGFGLGFGMVQAEHEHEDQLTGRQPSRNTIAMTSTPPSPDTLHHNHHHFPSASSLSVSAPLPPKQQQNQPWWLQQHPKTKRGCSASHHHHHHPNRSTSTQCYYCDAPCDTVACERCDKALCDMCTRFCDVCSATWCPCCTVIDYESPQERTLCFDCFDEEGGDGCRRGDGCGSSSSNLDSDGDDVMLSWQ